MRASYRYLTGSGAVVTAPTSFLGLIVTAGIDAASATVRDGGASGDVVLTLNAPAGQSVSFVPLAPVVLMRGLYVEITGTAPAVTVLYG